MTNTLHRRSAAAALMILAATWPTAALAHGNIAAKKTELAVYADLRQNWRDSSPLTFAVPGFMLGGDIGPGSQGLTLAHAGALLAFNDGNGFSALLEAGAHGHHGGAASVVVEQAWFAQQRGALTLAAGRQFAAVGMRNTEHAPQAAFPDEGLAYRVFLGDHYLDDGVALSWRSATAVAGLAAWRGRFPAGGIGNEGNGAVSAHLDGKFSVQEALTLDVRVAVLAAQPDLRYDERFEPGHSHNPFVTAPTLTYFSGDSTLGVASLALSSTGIEWLAEYFYRQEDGQVRNLTQQAGYQGTQAGLATEVLWSPGLLSATRNWTLGVRYTALTANNTLTGPGAATLATQSGLQTNGAPAEISAVIAWRPSERQVLRLQASEAGDVAGGDSVTLQYAMQWSAQK